MAIRYNTGQRTHCHWFVRRFFSFDPHRLQFWTCIQEHCRWENSLSISTGRSVDIVPILISFVHTAELLSCILCKNVLFRKKKENDFINHQSWHCILRDILADFSQKMMAVVLPFLTPCQGFPGVKQSGVCYVLFQDSWLSHLSGQWCTAP